MAGLANIKVVYVDVIQVAQHIDFDKALAIDNDADVLLGQLVVGLLRNRQNGHECDQGRTAKNSSTHLFLPAGYWVTEIWMRERCKRSQPPLNSMVFRH